MTTDSNRVLRTVRFDFEGLSVHGVQGGAGFPVLLLHGSGPGASSAGNWSAVLSSLAARFRVLAIDLIGFGRSARRPAQPYFDFSSWCRQGRAALDLLGDGPVGILGHSLSGAIALTLAAVAPDRVSHVVTTGTMGTALSANDFLRHVWRCPRSREEMRQAARVLIHDPALISAAYLDQRMSVIGASGYADYFDAMFEGDLLNYPRASELSNQTIESVKADVLMIHGRQDRAFPAEETTLRLAPRLARCDVALLDKCSHSIALEHPRKLVALCSMHFPNGI